MFRKNIYLFGLLVLSACTRTDPPSVVETPRGKIIRGEEKFHTVKDGETTLQIARMYDMREDELVRINGIKPPFKLFKGQRLKVKPHSRRNHTGPDNDRVQEEKDVEVTPLQPIGDGSYEAGGLASTASLPVLDANQQPFSPPEGSPQQHPDQHVGPKSPSAWQSPISKGNIVYKLGDKLPNGTTSDGVTWKAPAGTPVVAAQKGTILKAGQEVPAYGNMVVVKHADGKLSVYTHLKQIDKSVKVGKPIERGQAIGQVGKTGQVNEPQLHFQIRSADSKRSALDPLNLIS